MVSPGAAVGGRRILAGAVATFGLLVGLLAAAAPASAAQVTYTYEVRGRGNTTSLEDFAARAAETYASPAGWSLGGSIALVRVADGGDFTLWLSAPQYLPAFSSGCSTEYSCRVGRNVIINEARWRGGSSAWNATGASLRDYQHMVVNHETGHWLGFGHASCPGAGRLAPLMQQQSKSMQGCRPNAWPTAAERDALARWKGVSIVPPPPTGPPLEQAQAFVRQAYRDVLGREADPAGLQSWSAAVHDGWLSRQALTMALIRSSEGTQRAAAEMYRTILRRAPDPAGLAGWSTALSGGLRFKDVRTAFWSSSERLAASGTLQQWVADLYRTELRRPADPAGAAYWTATAQHQGPQAVASGIIASPEWSGLTVEGLYGQMLHRASDPAGLAGWSTALATSDTSDVQAAFGGSDEYFALALAVG